MTKAVNRSTEILIFVLFFSIFFFVLPVCPNSADAASLGINASMSATSLKQGGTVALKATANGGTSSYQYKFVYKIDNGSWQIAKDYSSSNTASVKLSSGGTYTLRSIVKDSKNLMVYCDMTANVAKVIQPIANDSTISATKINYGSTIKVTGKATGGDGTYYYYAYQYKAADGSWVTPKSWSTQTSLTIKLPSPGYYAVKVTVKDKDNRRAEKSFNVAVVSKTGKTLANSSAVSATKLASTANLTVTGKATGGTQPYKYSFYYKKTDVSSWTTVKTNQQSAACTFKLSTAGYYNVKCVVTDIDGKQATKTFTVTSTKNTGSALANSSKLNVNTANLFDQNSTVKMQATASGGTQPYQYAYYYKIDNGSFQTAKTYSQTTAYSLKLSKAGKYTLRISVKDVTGKVVNKDYTIESVPTVSASLLSSMTPTKLTYGFAVTVNASNFGSGARYAFYCKKSTDTQWERIQPYTASRTVSVRPRYLGQYIVRAYILKDGKITTQDTVINTELPSQINKEFTILNQIRTENGLKKFSLDNDLCFLAGVRAEELTAKYSHIRPDGTSCFTVYDEYGISFTTITGENIASGYYSANDVVNAWMNSSGHRANILNSRFTKVGLSFNQTQNRWTQLFSD